jgi:3-oxoacyl-[acyl-carrier-protein] synthase II
MEPWQRIGTFAAGLALEDAGLKGKKELLGHTDMIVAANGGERDLAVDSAILSQKRKAANPGAFLNERLMSDLRPTLFLAQLSNLLAGNISIVHGVTGSSRTFMGEDAAGVDAVRIAAARIAAGQSEVTLVGGSFNGEREDAFLLYNAGGYLLSSPFKPVWERSASPGMVIGSLGAFVVLEERGHAEARHAKPLARLVAVVSDRSPRHDSDLTRTLARMWEKVAPRRRPAPIAVISGATGTEPATGGERAWLETLPEIAVRASGSKIGHAFEPQFPMNMALGALVLGRGELFPPLDSSGIEQEHQGGGIDQVAITCVGHWRGEGMALLEAVK